MTNGVLIVTSSDTLSLRLRHIVEAAGGRAATPASPAEILAAAADKAMRLLLTDGRPPGLDIDTLLAGWRAAADGKPALLVGQGTPADDLIIVASGAWDRLAAEVQRLLGPPPPTDEAAAFADALAQASILIVDDSVTYREYLRQELTKDGARIRATGKVDEVATLLEDEVPDCVIVDLVMPGLDGARLCQQLAALRRQRAWRFWILVMSSREGEADLIRSLTAGADDFLGKSQNAAVLKAKLRALLRRKFMMDRFIG